MHAKLEAIAIADLATVSGGMKWDDFRRSTRVEDRRSNAAKWRDEEWFNGRHASPTAPVPLPQPRPDGR
jgi:hypothetical protein